MSSLFAGVSRGRPLPGPKAVAGYIWDDSTKWRRVYRLPYAEFGLIELNGTITGFTGWIDEALARRAAPKVTEKESETV
jgi:hypothetical protein